MATTKVSALSALTSPDGAEELLINDGGTSKKITIDNVTENNFTDTLKTKLDAIEASADVTDATNVDAAGAVMESDYTTAHSLLVQQSGSESPEVLSVGTNTIVGRVTGGGSAIDDLSSTQVRSLLNVEDGADVTDATNVTAAGALMDSEVTNLAEVKAFAASDYATAAQGTLATNALPKAGGAMTGAITTNSTFDGRDVATDGTKLDGIAASSNNYVHPNHSGDVTSTADGATVIAAGAVDIAMMSATGTASSSTYLRGDNAWSTVDALPSQTGHAGKYLTTNASAASWATLDTDANTTTKGLYEHEHTIDADYSITSGNNAISASPITISSGYSVTVPTGSTWVIV